ncbi:M48 family metallopeptidase [Rhizobium ruizarguesonis]
MRLTLRYGPKSTEYDVRENARLVVKLRIHVETSGVVVVEAPVGTSESKIRAGVQKRARWIMDHIDRFEEYRRHVLPRDYCNGETHFYLGRRHKLKILPGAKRSVRLIAGRLEVTAPLGDAVDVRLALQRWYSQRASAYFDLRLARLANQLPWVDQAPPVKLLKMKRYWGSCSPQGAITLNPMLIKAPVQCVEYVLLHELCHLVEHNHSPHFYALLDRHMPEWREAKDELDSLSEMLLIS